MSSDITGDISNNPLKRVTPDMKKMLKREDILFDIHCHVFNYKDVPDKFIGIRIPFNRVFLLKAESFLHRIIKRTDEDKFSNLAWFIHFFKNSSPSEIISSLVDSYSDRSVVLCPLMMDFAHAINGKIIDDYQVQIEKLNALRNLLPDRILPFFAADPNNPRLLENFIRVFSRTEKYNFFGIKIYPSLGYLPSNPRLMEIFEICEEKGIPVTAHCSGATVHSSKKIISGIQGSYANKGKTFLKGPVTRVFITKRHYGDFFNQPYNWIPVLKKFPNLRLNLAHFGGEEQWMKFIEGDKNSWVTDIISMIDEFDFLYTDFSYNMYNKLFFSKLKEVLNSNEKLSNRVLYGSDYYMLIKEGQFCDMLSAFNSEMGELLINKITRDNPRRFLFG